MTKLDSIIAEFDDLDYQERLELMLDFAEKLPKLPKRYWVERNEGLGRIPECMTPVFMWIEVEGGSVRLVADVAPEAPMVKGFVSILLEAWDGATPREIEAAPANILERLGLAEKLGMTRMRGLTAIVYRIKNAVAKRIRNQINAGSSESRERR